MSKKSYSLAEIAQHINAELVGDAGYNVTGVAAFATATNKHICFEDNPKQHNKLKESNAAAFIVANQQDCPEYTNLLVVNNPRLAFAKALELFDQKQQRRSGIHPSAVIAPTSTLADSVVLGANVTIGHDCNIGANTIIKANAVIADNVTIGKDCIIHEGAVIGSDGFGNANEKGQWYKIPQIGGVIIKDNVEVGANSTIDCGTLGNTIISNGVRIDNLVQIGHNVEIGEHTAIASQTGIAGSTKIGAYCMFAGQVGVAGHLTICDKVVFTGKSAVTNSVKKPGVYSSNTGLMENNAWRKMVVRLRGLDAMARIVKKLEKLNMKGAN